MWKWKRLKDAESGGAMTFVMDTPMGYVLRTVHPAQLGRGPGYNAHPIPASEALVFLPTNGFPSAYKEDAPPCE